MLQQEQTSIDELHDIENDLGTMLEINQCMHRCMQDQSHHLDLIADQIDTTQLYVEEACAELSQATRYAFPSIQVIGTGLIIGGCIGGPVGLLAVGLKTAIIGMCTGAIAGGYVSKKIKDTVQRKCLD